MSSVDELYLAEKSEKRLNYLGYITAGCYSQPISLDSQFSNGVLLIIVETGYLAVPISHPSEFLVALQSKRISKKSADYHVVWKGGLPLSSWIKFFFS